MCGTYLKTRGNTYIEKTKAIGDRCISIQSLVGPNLLDEREHDYRLVKPVMSKKAYAERMFMKISWEANFRIFSTFVMSFITICNKKYGKDANAEKKAWRSICLSS